MDPNIPEAIRRALERRAGNARQQTPPSSSPSTPPPGVGPQQHVQPAPGMAVGNPEAEIILKALTQRLNTISELEKGGVR